MNQEKRDLDAKKVKKLLILSAVLFAAGISFLAGLVILQDQNALSTVRAVALLIGFFACFLMVLVLLFRVQPYLMMSGLEKWNQCYEEKELTELPLTGKEELEERLSRQKFRLMEGEYYTRSRFSFWKDVIHYYVRVVEDVDIESAIQRESARFDRMGKAKKNFCLLLFIYLERVGEYEKEMVKNFVKHGIMLEEFQPQSACSVLAVAVDERTNAGYFLDMERRSWIVLYSYGSRMLKKIAERK